MHRVGYDIAALLIGAFLFLGAATLSAGPAPAHMAERPFHPTLA